MAESSFDFPSFSIGLLTGAIIMLIITWILYATRSFTFTYCASTYPTCGSAQYFNDPGEALANNPGLTAGSILFLGGTGTSSSISVLYYQRVPKTNTCVPGANQTVAITYPEFCTFENIGGGTATWVQDIYNTNIYRQQDGPFNVFESTDGNCIPKDREKFRGGKPIVEWSTGVVL